MTKEQVKKAYDELPDAEKVRRLELRACAYLDWLNIDMPSKEALMSDVIEYEKEWVVYEHK